MGLYYKRDALMTHMFSLVPFLTLCSVATARPSFDVDEVVSSLRSFASNTLEENDWEYAPSEDYPYWNFIPQYQASVLMTGEEVSWSSPCFSSNTATAQLNPDTSEITITITASNDGNTFTPCSEEYVFLTANLFSINHVLRGGTARFVLNVPVDATEAEMWDIENKGVRIMRLLTSTQTAVSNILATAELFLPLHSVEVPPELAQLNAEFMSTYPQFPMTKLESPHFSPPPPEEVHNGDLFLILRLDGLNTMLAWAMGSTTGHVTSALWIDNELYIVESEGEVNYWPKHGVMRTPYKEWLQQIQAASYNIIHAPLTSSAREKYNATAALRYFESVEGLEYGYWTQLWGWLDTAELNFPCLPPDYISNCMTWHLFEPILSIVDRLMPLQADTLWNDGFNKRLGTVGLRTAEVYMAAAEKGMRSSDLYQIVEQDVWTYNMTSADGEPVASGSSMVCCVFACAMWKHAGVLGTDEEVGGINCEEFTNFDLVCILHNLML